VAGSATDLFGVCEELLEACAAAVASKPGGAITRVYVSPGAPAFDCEQITVHAGGPTIGDTMPLQPPLQPGHRLQTTGQVNLVQLTATVLRCVPTLEEDGGNVFLPDPGAMESAALFTLADVWAVCSYIKTKFNAGELFNGPLGRTRELFIDPALPVPTSGGFGGWQITIRVQLDGYNFDA
jgi:hypothetical protein